MSTTYRAQFGTGFGTMNKQPQVSKTVYVNVPSNPQGKAPILVTPKGKVRRRRKTRVYKGSKRKRSSTIKASRKKSRRTKKKSKSKKRSKVVNF